MKQRRFWLVLLGILLLISVTVAASAESGGKLPYVTDAANLLTDEQHMALEARAEEISQTYSSAFTSSQSMTIPIIPENRISGMPMWIFTRPTIWAGARRRQALPS